MNNISLPRGAIRLNVVKHGQLITEMCSAMCWVCLERYLTWLTSCFGGSSTVRDKWRIPDFFLVYLLPYMQCLSVCLSARLLSVCLSVCLPVWQFLSISLDNFPTAFEPLSLSPLSQFPLTLQIQTQRKIPITSADMAPSLSNFGAKFPPFVQRHPVDTDPSASHASVRLSLVRTMLPITPDGA